MRLTGRHSEVQRQRVRAVTYLRHPLSEKDRRAFGRPRIAEEFAWCLLALAR